jgi:hypothetical protein
MSTLVTRLFLLYCILFFNYNIHFTHHSAPSSPLLFCFTLLHASPLAPFCPCALFGVLSGPCLVWDLGVPLPLGVAVLHAEQGRCHDAPSETKTIASARMVTTPSIGQCSRTKYAERCWIRGGSSVCRALPPLFPSLEPCGRPHCRVPRSSPPQALPSH